MSNGKHEDEKITKIKQDIEALRMQESILLDTIANVDPETAEDLQTTLDSVSSELIKLNEQLAKLEQQPQPSIDQDALLALQLMQEEDEKERQRQKSIEMAKQIQREQEEASRLESQRYAPSAGHEEPWQEVHRRKDKRDKEDKSDSDEEKENKFKKSVGKQKLVGYAGRWSGVSFS